MHDNFTNIDFELLSSICKKNGLIIDSSTIIYLDKIFIIESFLDNYKVFTTDETLSEIFYNKEKSLNIMNFNEKINKIKYEEIFNSDLFQNISKSLIKRLSISDMRLLQISISSKLPIFSDDGTIIKISSILSIPYYNSIIAVLLLLYDDIIDDKKAINSLFSLYKIGRYNDKIFSFATIQLEKIIKNNKI